MIVAGDHRFLSSRLSQAVGIIDGREGVCQRKKWEGSLLASCARETRTMGMCSFDARSGRPNRPPSCEKHASVEGSRGWSLMIFCARATRGRGLPSLDARNGRSVSPHPWRENEQAWRGIYIVRCAQQRAALTVPLKRDIGEGLPGFTMT